MSLADKSQESSSEDINPAALLKKRRTQSRRRVTLAIKRIREILGKGQGEENKRRLKKEIEQLRKDYETAREHNGELYDLVGDEEHEALDQWENELTNDVFSIEEEVENSLSPPADLSPPSGLPGEVYTSNEGISAGNVNVGSSDGGSGGSTSQVINSSESSIPQGQLSHSEDPPASHIQNQEVLTESPGMAGSHENSHANNGHIDTNNETYAPQASLSNSDTEISVSKAEAKKSHAFDSWIDDLVEFQETVVAKAYTGTATIADALFKLEASKDVPSIKLPFFDGDALSYTDFIDHFKVHIHDKSHLTDDTRMIQLRMHLTGEAERAISGLGSKGIMYATALKSLKEQFGQPSVIARAVVNKLTNGERIGRNNRQALREFSLDIINCLSIMHRLNYSADLNANDNLRRIVMRLPDYLVDKWKGVVADIRDRGQVPRLQHISDFVRKRVKAEFDPDFGDIQSEFGGGGRGRKGIHSSRWSTGKKTKCPICEGVHTVPTCPTLNDSTVDERFKFVTKARLCFSCLSKGHMKIDCRSRKKCEIKGCQRFHHSLLHADPPTSGVAPVLDKNGILPVVRVRFRAPNGRIREGNVLIDSGASTTVIRKDFAMALGLQGKRERVDLALLGGETVKQPDSRRLKFWISPIEGSEEFSIEAHEIEKTVFVVPPLDRQWLLSFNHLSDIVLSYSRRSIQPPACQM